MKISQQSLAKILAITLTVTFLACSIPERVASAQDAGTILAGADLSQVVPPGFYFQGRSAPTQMRNAVAARFGSTRYVIAGLVDTAGYAADVRDKYQGFLVTDSAITIGGSEVATGAYGFGFVKDKVLIMDLSGKEILSIPATKDDKLARPRPLMMTKTADGIRLYSGRNYVNIVAK